MPLILAIEPDRRQANQLNAMVRGRLQAELVLADSAEAALAALGDRVPDLILTAALLSPNDEVVLGERLRALDAAASHVQTLTIPVLAAPRTKVRERAGGVLSALRREKPRDAAPDGCDPAVFAAQCAEYLERAHAERELAASAEARRVEDAVAEPIVDEAVVEPIAADEAVAEPIAEEWSVPEPVVAETFAQSPVVQQAVAPEPIVHEAPVQPPVTRAKAVNERKPRLPVHESAAIHTVSQAIASLSQLFEEPAEEIFQDHEQAVQAQAPVEPELPEGMVELDLSTILEDAADRVAETVDEPEVYDLAMSVETDDGTVEAEFVAALEESDQPANGAELPSASVMETHAPGRFGNTSLWPTIEQAYAEARSASSRTDTVRPISTRSAVGVNRGHRDGKPVQDEWGFFDPEQCGFAALIAKLDEIIENTDDAPLTHREIALQVSDTCPTHLGHTSEVCPTPL